MRDESYLRCFWARTCRFTFQSETTIKLLRANATDNLISKGYAYTFHWADECVDLSKYSAKTWYFVRLLRVNEISLADLTLTEVLLISSHKTLKLNVIDFFWYLFPHFKCNMVGVAYGCSITCTEHITRSTAFKKK